MKKLMALILALLLVLSLGSCGGSPSGTVTPAESSEPEQAAEPVETEEPEQAAEPEEPAQPEEALEIGTVQGGTYTNEFLGITCTLGEEWTIASEEELLDMAGLTADAIADEDLAETIQNSGLIYDFYATAQDGLISLNVVIEDLGVLYGLALDENGYLEASQEELAQAMESIGLEDGEVTIGTMTFAGQDHGCSQVVGTLYEVPFYETQVCVKVGNYMAVVTAASFQEDVTGDLLGMFTAVE